MKYLATPSSIFVFISSSSTGELSALSQRQWSSNRPFFPPEHGERSFWDLEYSFVAVRRILRTIFAKQRLCQLRTNYKLDSPNAPNYAPEQLFAQLRTGLCPSLKHPTRKFRNITMSTAKDHNLAEDEIDSRELVAGGGLKVYGAGRGGSGGGGGGR